jgi:GNAT superfamily N-acetyltransferase
MTFEVSDSPDQPALAEIELGLTRHALGAGIEPRNHRPLQVLVRDDLGDVIGGLVGATVWGWLDIKVLWVSETERGKGLGGQLLLAAEEAARGRGCHHAVVDTFDFQAPAFYEQLGYRVVATLPDFPRGHARFYLTKPL